MTRPSHPDPRTDCEAARDALWPPERPRLAEDVVVEARRHVRDCPSCQDYLAQDRMLLEAYARLRRKGAPRHVRERVFEILARERASGGESDVGEGTHGGEGTGRAPRARRWGSAALALVVLALVGASGVFLVTQSAAPTEGADMFVEDYLRRAVAEDRIRSSDPAEVTRFLNRELGLALDPIRGSGLLLAGAEICLLEGRRGAMIVYEKEGRRILHYVVPHAGGRHREPVVSTSPSTGEVGGSPAVVVWSSASTEQALVGALAPSELIDLARRAGGGG